jgi:hypothetical protein
MDTQTSAEEMVLARLRESFPHWHIGRFVASNDEPCAWMATRRRVLTTGEMRRGLMHSLVADSAERLRDALAGQRRIELSAIREPA